MSKSINCQHCKFWAYDMDMDPFCMHKNANPIGTDITVMRGTKRTPNMRGSPCGPSAKFFVKSSRPATV